MDVSAEGAGLLKEGIAAAKAGQSEHARLLLKQATEQTPEDARAWLWLSSVTPALAERVTCLETALRLQPQNTAARQGLEALYQLQTQEWLRDGLAAQARGDRVTARRYLMQVVERDESALQAWWTLAQVAETPEERRVCLENVLTLDPQHEAAQAQLRVLPEAHGENAAEPLFEEVPLYAAVTPSPVWPEEADDAELAPRVETTPQWDALDNPTLCPYCAALTCDDDAQCQACAQPLWLARRTREDLSIGYRVSIALEGALAFIGLLLPVLLLSYAGFQLRAQDWIGDDYLPQLIAIYLGGRAPDLLYADILFVIVPPSLVWLSLLPSLLSLPLVVLFMLRWPPSYFWLLMNEGLRVASLGILLLAFFVYPPQSVPVILGMSVQQAIYDLGLDLTYRAFPVVSVVLLIATVVALIMAQRLADHFSEEHRRLRLQIDADVAGSETGLWLRGREYLTQKRWAAAVLHLWRALGAQRRIEVYSALILACLGLKRRDLARDALARARRVFGETPQVVRLAQLIEAEPMED